MYNRDFSLSQREYIKKNKTSLIVVGILLVVAVVMGCILGFNTTPDFKGAYLVDITVGGEMTNSKLDNYTKDINEVLKSYGLSLNAISVKGEGDLTTLEIRYVDSNKLDKIAQVELNELTIASLNESLKAKLGVADTAISEHLFLKGKIQNSDIIYTWAAGLTILVIATILMWIRHNLAYAICGMMAGIFAPILLMSVITILRTPITETFLAIVLGSMILTLASVTMVYENMRHIRLNTEHKKDKSKHLILGLKKSATMLQFTMVSVFVLGLLLVVFGPLYVRYTAIDIMFAVVASLASVLFVMPFVYNLVIETAKFRDVKPKKNEKQTVITAEGNITKAIDNVEEFSNQDSEQDLAENADEGSSESEEVVLDKAESTIEEE